MSIRTEAEIQHQLNEAADNASHQGRPTKWPGLTFEDGVLAALEWITDSDATAPMEEDADGKE